MIELEEEGDAGNHHPGIKLFDEYTKNKLEMRQRYSIFNFLNQKKKKRYYIFTILLLSIILFSTISLLILFIFLTIFKKEEGNKNNEAIKTEFYKRIETKNILKHLQIFQNIAIKNNNSRSPQFGYNETGEYILNQLSKYKDKLKIEIQPFQIEEYLIKKNPKFSSLSSSNGNLIEYKLDIEFNQLSYSGSGNLKNLTLTNKIKNKGCNEMDYSFFNGTTTTTNYLFLIQRGDCTFFEKVSPPLPPSSSYFILILLLGNTCN